MLSGAISQAASIWMVDFFLFFFVWAPDQFGSGGRAGHRHTDQQPIAFSACEKAQRCERVSSASLHRIKRQSKDPPRSAGVSLRVFAVLRQTVVRDKEVFAQQTPSLKHNRVFYLVLSLSISILFADYRRHEFPSCVREQLVADRDHGELVFFAIGANFKMKEPQ